MEFVNKTISVVVMQYSHCYTLNETVRTVKWICRKTRDTKHKKLYTPLYNNFIFIRNHYLALVFVDFETLILCMNL